MLERERIPYLKTLMYIIASDGELDEKELQFFVDAGTACGLNSSEIMNAKNAVVNESEPIEDILGGITEEESKTELLSDLLTLCYIDSDYSILEQVGMRAICEIMNVDESRLITLEKETETRVKNEKNPFNQFANSPFGSKMLAGMKQAADATASGAQLLGKQMKIGGNAVARSVTFGIGFVGNKVGAAVESAKKLREENAELREKLCTLTVSETIKQRVILQLHEKITALTDQLNAERERNRRNEEMIGLLQAQLEDLAVTMAVAQNAKTA